MASVAGEVMVKLQSVEKVPAKVIASNAITDVALIRLLWMRKEYKLAKVASLANISVGEEICIIGSPFGLERSISVGYICGRHKEKGNRFTFSESEYFQTNAAINHGNSVGPMFNTKGEVIGAVSSTLTQSIVFEGFVLS